MKRACIASVIILLVVITSVAFGFASRDHEPNPSIQPVVKASSARVMLDDPPQTLPDLICTLDCLIECLCVAPEPPCPAPAHCQPCLPPMPPSLGKILLAIDDGVFPSEDKSWVADDLDTIEATIEDIQDEEIGPNLDPVDAGMPGQSRTFTSLLECAEQCVEWAVAANAEAHTNDPDHAVIGYALDSIRLALPQFRTLGDLD